MGNQYTFLLMLFSVIIFIKIKTLRKMVMIPLFTEVVLFLLPCFLLLYVVGL